MRSSFSFDYTPNLTDVKFGIHLAQWGSSGRKIRTLVLGFVFPATLMTAWLSIGTDGIAIPMAVGAGLAFGAAWGVLFFTAFNAWLAQTILSRQTRNGATQSVVVDDRTVEHRNSVSAHSVSWAAVTSVREFDRTFLLMTGERPIGAIEKAGAGSPAELDELRSFIKSIKPLEPGAGLALGSF
jgi:hypothetical protein